MMRGNGGTPLGLLHEGERAVILEFEEELLERELRVSQGACGGGCGGCHGKRHGKREKLRRLVDMGFERGKVLEVIKNRPGQPLIVRLENSQIALSRGLAMKILVSKEEVRA